MKLTHWTVLAVCLASCRASDHAPALGPGSRVVIPELAQPRPQEPIPPAAAPVRIDPLPREAPRARLPLAIELLAQTLREALSRTTLKVETAPTVESEPASVATQVVREATAPDSPGVVERDSDPSASADDPATQALIEALLEDLEAERWGPAHEKTGHLMAMPSLEKARELRAAGKFEEELAVLDQALKADPERLELLEAAGNVRLALAGSGKPELYDPALKIFLRAGDTPIALLGASRAARALGEIDEALEFARKAMLLLVSQPERRLAISPAPEIVLADAGRLVLKKLGGTAATALFEELEAALEWRVRSISTDAAAYACLVNLYLDVGRVERAVPVSKYGLNFSPGDGELAGLLARACLSLGGTQMLLDEFSEFRRSFPYQPLGYWHPALEYFKSSVARETLPKFKGSGKDQLDDAREYFSQVRRLDPRYTKTCRQYEALCWALAGRELFDAERFDEARAAFRSMNDCMPGGVALDPSTVDEWAASIGSGASWLEKIAAHYREANELVKAAEVLGELADLLPDDPHWAREAASSAGDAAESLADDVKAFGRAIAGEVRDQPWLERLRKLARVAEKDEGTSRERERFRVAMETRKQESEELFERSWERYQHAVRLAPLDAQLACNAARIAIYHIPRDLPRAESLLDGAIRLAREQLQAPQLELSAKDQWKSILCGALSEQGVLKLARDDPQAAVLLFEEVVELDPLRFQKVRDVLLPQAREASSKR